MISTAKIQGNVDYYLGGDRKDADRAASYYLDDTSGEPPGFWQGAGASALGLSGVLDAEEFKALYTQHLDPRDARFADPSTRDEARPLGARLPAYSSPEKVFEAKVAASTGTPTPEDRARMMREAEKDGRRALLAIDLTFSPPKDFTLVLAAAGYAERDAAARGDVEGMNRWAQRRRELVDAAHAANRAGLEYAAEVAGYARRQEAGVMTYVKGGGLVVATFEQHDNRAGAPSWHAHNPVLNKIECPDGKWRTLEGEGLLNSTRATSAIADRALREQMEALGYPTVARPEAQTWAIEGISDAVRDSVSERSQEVTAKTRELVEAWTERYGRSPTAAEQSHLHKNANKITRAAKVKGTSTGELLDRAQAAVEQEIAGGLAALAARHEHVEPGQSAPAAWSPVEVIAVALDVVQAEKTTWTRWDLTRRIEEQLPVLGVSAGEVAKVLHTLTDQALAQVDMPVVRIAGGVHAPDAPVQMRRADGTLTYESPTAHRYALASHLDREAGLRAAAVVRDRAAAGPEVARAAVSRFVAGQDPDYALSADQRATAAQLMAGGARLATLIGPAGTGKSTTIGSVAAMWPEVSSGGRVVGVAVSQRAADELRDAGVPATLNTAQFFEAQDRIAAGRPLPGDEAFRLRANDKLVIDEASMMTTAQWDRLMVVADRSATAVVATGDPAQMGPVGAGGVMADLAADPTAEVMTLSCVHRFAEQWEGPASLRLRDGDPDVVGEYARQGRLYAAGDDAGMRRTAADMYVAARVDGKSAAVMAETNEAANRISALVRDQLVALGVVDDERVVQLGRDKNTAGVGDVIACRRVDHDLQLVNRQKLEVLSIGEDGSMEAVTPTGVVRHIPAAYVAEHVQLGYAATAHGEQGATVDVGIAAVTRESSRGALYTESTRGREQNLIVCQTEYAADRTQGQSTDQVPAMRAEAVVAAVLDGAGAEKSAATQVAEWAEHSASGRTIGGQYELTMQTAVRERTDRCLDRLTEAGMLTAEDRAAFAADTATGQLSRMLRSAEQAGHDADAVLEKAVARGSFRGAKSVAQVTIGRIDKLGLDLSEPRPEVPVAGMGPEWNGDLDDKRARLGEREAHLGWEAAEAGPDAPAWAVEAFGPVPDGESRIEWEAQVGRVARTREVTGWEDQARALGGSPSTLRPEARAEWHEAWSALGRPEGLAEEAGMTTGRLLARWRAAERIEEQGPAYVDEHMGATLQRAETARREAALAGARGDAGAAEQLRAEADRLTEAGQSLREAAAVRDEHVEAATPTLEVGRRALQELQARGEDPGDLVTTTGPAYVTEHDLRDEVVEAADLVDEHHVEEISSQDREEARALDPPVVEAGEVLTAVPEPRPELGGPIVDPDLALAVAMHSTTRAEQMAADAAQVADYAAAEHLVAEADVRRRRDEAAQHVP